MKTKSLISQMEKAGFNVIVPSNDQTRNREYSVSTPKYYISWYNQNENVICLHVSRHNDISDPMTDYHAGFFVRTIKSAIKYAKEI